LVFRRKKEEGRRKKGEGGREKSFNIMNAFPFVGKKMAHPHWRHL